MFPTGLVLTFCLLCWACAERERDRTVHALRTEVTALRQAMTPPTPRRLTLSEVHQAINSGEAAGVEMTHLRVAYAQELLDEARAQGRMPPLNVSRADTPSSPPG